jgi:hypothetical protein
MYPVFFKCLKKFHRNKNNNINIIRYNNITMISFGRTNALTLMTDRAFVGIASGKIPFINIIICSLASLTTIIWFEIY